MFPLTMLLLIIAIVEGLLLWYLRSELKKKDLEIGWRKLDTPLTLGDLCEKTLNVPHDANEIELGINGTPSWKLKGGGTRPLTARDIAAGNLQRQVEQVRAAGREHPVTRKPHDWKALRTQIEEGIERSADKDNERDKRVENYLGESNAH